MQISEIYKIYKNYPIISTDSRKIIENSIFFSLKGETFDGNAYAAEALKKGASYAIVDNKTYKHGDNIILVDNVLDTLQQLANFHRKQLGIPIIAITGTNGKTTTKELITSVISKKFNVKATIGNLNNHIGVPLTLLSMNPATEIGVVEMGANHLNEINMLCNIARPDYGLITNIGKAHLEGFGSFKGVIKAKTELYNFIEKSSGTVFYNTGNPIITKNAGKLNCKKIGYGKGSSITAQIISSDPYLTFTVHIADKSQNNFLVNTQLVGGYNLENILASVCIGLHFDISISDIINAIESYGPTNFRSQFIKKGNNQLLLDLYNANPTSMEAALRNFKMSSSKGLNKILIVGEMLELGKESKKEHKKVMQLIENLGFIDVYLVGKGFSGNRGNSFKYFETTQLLKAYLAVHKIQNSYILVKGSRGVKLENILDCF